MLREVHFGVKGVVCVTGFDIRGPFGWNWFMRWIMVGMALSGMLAAAEAQDTAGTEADYVYMGCMWAGAYDETYWLYGHMTNQTSKYGADHRFCSCVR
jgi:hypothetical protein